MFHQLKKTTAMICIRDKLKGKRRDILEHRLALPVLNKRTIAKKAQFIMDMRETTVPVS